MSHLSTSTTNKKESSLKDVNVEIEKIPNYLTKKNKSFKQMLNQALSTMKITTANNNNNQMEELRKIAILIYKIMVIQSYHALWATYLKAGIGQLINQSQQDKSIYPTNISIWPKVIKKMIELTENNKTNENEICMAFVNNNLRQLDNQLKQHEAELKIQTTNFKDYTLAIQQMIEPYIKQNLSGLYMEIEHKIQLIHYDYHIQALKVEYFRQNPNEYQVCFSSRAAIDLLKLFLDTINE
jgi:hypothetical protein